MIRNARDDRGEETALPLFVFGPVFALGSATTLIALIAALFNWYPDLMLATAGVTGAVLIMLAVALVYRQAAKTRAADRALRSTEARMGDIIDSAMDAIIATDDSQRIVLYNPAAEKVFLWPREAVLGRPLDMLLPERFRAPHREHIHRFGEAGITSRRMRRHTVLAGLRSDGKEFPIEASISQHSESGKKVFTVILRDVTERVQAENELRRSQQDLREIASMSQSAREQEKTRIARELHDELAQSLTALKMDLAWTAERLGARESALSDKISRMQTLLDTTVAATRRISADLRPLMLDDLGLAAAVEWLIESFRERNAIECELVAPSEDLDLREPLASCVFRILQESLTNVARHSGASFVQVALARSDGEITLTVKDDGRGFSPDAPRKPDSYGLMGLRERAYLVGGRVAIDSGPGKGVRIDVRIPLAQEEPGR
jgi:PAS domain S-box-containing protein